MLIKEEPLPTLNEISSAINSAWQIEVTLEMIY